MPTPINLIDSSASTRIDSRLSYTFEANLDDLPRGGYISPAVHKVPAVHEDSPGNEWTWAISAGHQGEVSISCRHDFLPIGSFGEVSVEITLKVLHEGEGKVLHSTHWTPEARPRRNYVRSYNGNVIRINKSLLVSTHPWFGDLIDKPQRYRVTATYKSDACTAISASGDAALSTADRARLASADDIGSTPVSKDVRLLFPGKGQRPAELWTTRAFLGQISPYFAALFASGCVETTPRSLRISSASIASAKPFDGGSLGPEVANGLDTTRDWLDSDDEAEGEESIETRFSNAGLVRYYEISFAEVASATFQAVLLYFKTGYIAFAPLTSSFVATLDARTRYEQEYRAYAALHPGMPRPVSPKSVYRLAHLLQIPDLQKLALDHISSGLTAEGVAYEFFSPVALAYEEVRRAARDFIVKHFDEVSTTKAWQNLRAQAAAGEIEGGARVLKELLKAVSCSKRK